MSPKSRSRVTRTRASSRHADVRTAAEAMIQYCANVMSGLAQQRDCLVWNILVELEAQRLAPRSDRNGDDPLPSQVRGVGERRPDVLRLQGRIVGENPLRRLRRGKIVEHDRHRHARAAETSGTVHDLRIGGDVRFPVHGSRADSTPPPGYPEKHTRVRAASPSRSAYRRKGMR